MVFSPSVLEGQSQATSLEIAEYDPTYYENRGGMLSSQVAIEMAVKSPEATVASSATYFVFQAAATYRVSSNLFFPTDVLPLSLQSTQAERGLEGEVEAFLERDERLLKVSAVATAMLPLLGFILFGILGAAVLIGPLLTVLVAYNDYQRSSRALRGAAAYG